VSLIGNGVQPLYTVNSVMQRVNLAVLYDCNNVLAPGCSAELERTLPVNFQAGVDRWGFRPVTLNARREFTRYQGRLVVTQNRAAVQMTGYDWAPEGMDLQVQPQKREAATVTLFLSGALNMSTFCRTPNTGSYSLVPPVAAVRAARVCEFATLPACCV
jgi:hypothetical protein